MSEFVSTVWQETQLCDVALATVAVSLRSMELMWSPLQGVANSVLEQISLRLVDKFLCCRCFGVFVSILYTVGMRENRLQTTLKVRLLDELEHSTKLIAAASDAKTLKHPEMYERWSVDPLRGFNLPRSANAYTIPGSNEMFKIVQGEEEAANMRIMDMVFAACVNLDVLVLRAVVTKGEGRQAQDIQWLPFQGGEIVYSSRFCLTVLSTGERTSGATSEVSTFTEEILETLTGYHYGFGHWAWLLWMAISRDLWPPIIVGAEISGIVSCAARTNKSAKVVENTILSLRRGKCFSSVQAVSADGSI
ncbi:hypothetical protein ARMGADRAFT_1059406 [Armillaria gallica]|uniref:Uncharacterized protein n=1 Tax=Armillaria gallica TaxID=47427 RepID=A0A2H3DYJ5_ARMGA|nr:hypothetical protein ARMGADRAFT_1059406 [Armillaria gallica]